MERETIEYKGCSIEVHYDEDAGCPFTEWDQMSTLVYITDTNRYRRQSMPDAGATFINAEYYYPPNVNERAAIEWLGDERIGVILPFRISDYGSHGWNIRVGTPGMPSDDDNAFLYVSRDTLLEEYSSKILAPSVKERALSLVRSELDVYTSWLNGDVYGYVAKDPDGGEISSTWGFYGDKGYVIEEAQRDIDEYVERMELKHSIATLAGI